MGQKYKPSIRENWCKGCGLCIAFCPKKVLAADALGRPLIQAAENCIGCGICCHRCPDMAIDIVLA